MNTNTLKSPLYSGNVGVVRRYSPSKYKLTALRSYRNPGVEDDRQRTFTAKGEAGNSEKLSQSLSRSKAKVFELAYCNPWELFCTFTLDKTKYNRQDLKKYVGDLSQFIRNYNRLKGVDVKYLLIPERHQDGAWHMHGFLMGLPLEHLTPFTLEQKLPYKIRARLKEGVQVYSWQAYAKKFGFTDIEEIGNGEAVSKYITKYVTEDITRTITELNAHLYYCSKGLRKSEVVYRDYLQREITSPDFSNEYVAVKWYDNLTDTCEVFA